MKQLSHQASGVSGFKAALACVRRLHRNESGTTLTEFVIMLPVFLMVFNGVMILGQFTRKGTEAPIAAYKDTFEKVIPFQKQTWFSGVHMHPVSGSIDAGISQLANTSKVHNVSTSVKWVANGAEASAYTRQGLQGSMGESYARAIVPTAMPGAKIQGCDGIGPAWPTKCEKLNTSSGINAVVSTFGTSNGKLTSRTKDVTDGSKYAYALFDDSISVPNMGGGSGLLGMLNQFLTATGIRPALAANIRYGTVSGTAGDPYTFAGITMDMRAHYSVLVPPTPKGKIADGAMANAVTRLTMAGNKQYDKLLGIAWNQPLSVSNFSVSPYFTGH